MKVDLIMDLGWGSSGKGGIAGWLAKRGKYKAVMCAYGRQAGHTYNDGDFHMMVQQLPVGIISPTAKDIFLGPGSIIHRETLLGELDRYRQCMKYKRLWIHENAAVVTDDHADREIERGQTKMGSTAKGVGQAVIDRILRDPGTKPTVGLAWANDPELSRFIADRTTYDAMVTSVWGDILIEGAQGFGLSLYHGDWPYCTSRDVTPAQLLADVALPWALQKEVHTYGVTRTRPIRVNNRDGSSGPCYDDQHELTWEEVGVAPEQTTVTKLSRRIFSFSEKQIRHAVHHCLCPGDHVVLTFVDYISIEELAKINTFIKSLGVRISHLVVGPDDSNVIHRDSHYDAQ